MNRLQSALCVFWSCFGAIAAADPGDAEPIYDIVVYGDSSGALTAAVVTAAVAAKRHGRSVILVNPTRFPGGMSASGLGATDFGGKRSTFGGIASEIYDAVAQAYVGDSYLHDDNTGKGKKLVRYEVKLPKAGRYEVRMSYTSHDNRASNVPVMVNHADGATKVTVNQQRAAGAGDGFFMLGVFRFEADQPAVVEISNKGTDGYVIADAVQLIAED